MIITLNTEYLTEVLLSSVLGNRREKRAFRIAIVHRKQVGINLKLVLINCDIRINSRFKYTIILK